MSVGVDRGELGVSPPAVSTFCYESDCKKGGPGDEGKDRSSKKTMALDDFVDCDPMVCVPRVQFLCSFFL